MKFPDVKTVTVWVSILLNVFQFASNQAKEWYVIVNSVSEKSMASKNPWNVENAPNIDRVNNSTDTSKAMSSK